MTKLYSSRKDKLINPLTKNEGGYVFESKNINQIINDIDEKKYGAYAL